MRSLSTEVGLHCDHVADANKPIIKSTQKALNSIDLTMTECLSKFIKAEEYGLKIL